MPRLLFNLLPTCSIGVRPQVLLSMHSAIATPLAMPLLQITPQRYNLIRNERTPGYTTVSLDLPAKNQMHSIELLMGRLRQKL